MNLKIISLLETLNFENTVLAYGLAKSQNIPISKVTDHFLYCMNRYKTSEYYNKRRNNQYHIDTGLGIRSYTESLYIYFSFSDKKHRFLQFNFTEFNSIDSYAKSLCKPFYYSDGSTTFLPAFNLDSRQIKYSSFDGNREVYYPTIVPLHIMLLSEWKVKKGTEYKGENARNEKHLLSKVRESLTNFFRSYLNGTI